MATSNFKGENPSYICYRCNKLHTAPQSRFLCPNCFEAGQLLLSRQQQDFLDGVADPIRRKNHLESHVA